MSMLSIAALQQKNNAKTGSAFFKSLNLKKSFCSSRATFSYNEQLTDPLDKLSTQVHADDMRGSDAGQKETEAASVSFVTKFHSDLYEALGHWDTQTLSERYTRFAKIPMSAMLVCAQTFQAPH